jgi:hypothetical protein
MLLLAAALNDPQSIVFYPMPSQQHSTLFNHPAAAGCVSLSSHKPMQAQRRPQPLSVVIAKLVGRFRFVRHPGV